MAQNVKISTMLNLVMCKDKEKYIEEIKETLKQKGYLSEDGEPTHKAWTYHSRIHRSASPTPGVREEH